MYDNVQTKTATGYYYYIKDFDIIGKTGTAQIYENGHYLQGDGDYIISFAGMFPYDDPEIIIYTAIKKPKTYHSEAIAPYVKEVIGNIAKYRNMYSEIEEKKTSIQEFKLESYTGKSKIEVTNSLKDKKLNIIVIGDGDKVIKQYPKRDTKVLSGDKLFLVTNGSNVIMPNMTNWSLKEVATFASLTGIKYTYSGDGYVVKQNIKAKQIINSDIEVVLKDKKYKK